MNPQRPLVCRQMNIMLYKEGPSFAELMEKLKCLELEIYQLEGGT